MTRPAPTVTDHPSALVSVPEPMIEAFRDWYALHFGRPIMKGKARKIVGRILSAAPAAPQASGVGEIAKACAVFQEAIDYFEADVADVMAEGSERADLWDREVTVNIDALKAVMNAALATREEAPAEAGDDVQQTISGETVCGFKVAAWQYLGPNDDAKFGHRYCEHWSTVGNHPKRVVRLFTEDQLRSALRAQPQAREDALRVAVEALEPFAYFAKHGTSREYINSDAPDDGLCAAASFPAGAYRGAVKALAAQPQAREDAQPVISAGRVLADALRQYGFPVSGGAKAALWDHGSAEALALNEACVAFLAALQAEQGAK